MLPSSEKEKIELDEKGELAISSQPEHTVTVGSDERLIRRCFDSSATQRTSPCMCTRTDPCGSDL